MTAIIPGVEEPRTDAQADSGAPLSVSAAVPSPEFLSLIPHDFARRHLVLSAGSKVGVEILLATERTKATALHNVSVRLRRQVRTFPVPAEDLATAIDRAYANQAVEGRSEVPTVVVQGSSDVAGDLDSAVREAERDLLSTQGKAPTVKLVDLVLFEALVRGASDVHVQPVRGRTLVRYRLDGVLHTARELPGSLASAVVSRIKVMARLDVAEQRAPQDGRASVTVGASGSQQAGRRVDLRISTLPSTYGERVVVRLLDPTRSPHLQSFTALGMPREMEQRYLEQCSKTSGIVLSTGPTGSGKTTTLYATLAWLCATNSARDHRADGCELNVMTIEDPVEYDLSDGGSEQERRGGGGLAISQTQVDPKKNVTFATGLRHILRQDPDVIMVGEVRDDETARIAVQASLTGHLVLSTLHTNDAASAVARLLDLGVEPFLVSSSLSAVLAQRLLRKVHGACGGRGCVGETGCLGTGYKGRTGVFELLVLDSASRDMVGRRCSAVEIKEAARRSGMRTLREAGEALVRQGVTTETEVTRVIEAVGELGQPEESAR